MDEMLVAIVVLLAIGSAIPATWAGRPRPRTTVASASRWIPEAQAADARRLLTETAALTSSLPPGAAIDAIEARLAQSLGKETPRALLIGHDPRSLRYVLSNGSTMFVEVAISAAADTHGSTVTLAVVRWLESGGLPVAGDALTTMRCDIEAVLRPAGSTA